MCFGLLLLESCLASKLLLPLSEAWDEHGEELGKADLAHSSFRSRWSSYFYYCCQPHPTTCQYDCCLDRTINRLVECRYLHVIRKSFLFSRLNNRVLSEQCFHKVIMARSFRKDIGSP